RGVLHRLDDPALVGEGLVAEVVAAPGDEVLVDGDVLVDPGTHPVNPQPEVVETFPPDPVGVLGDADGLAGFLDGVPGEQMVDERFAFGFGAGEPALLGG